MHEHAQEIFYGYTQTVASMNIYLQAQKKHYGNSNPSRDIGNYFRAFWASLDMPDHTQQ